MMFRALPSIRNMARLILGLAIAVVLPMTAAQAQWWQKDWPYRKQVTVDTSPSGINVSGPIGRTLVLVRLHSGNFTFTEALDNGADIRFVDSDDKTPLPFHIDRYDAKTGIATVWVSVPALNGGEKRNLWLYFGNKNAKVGEDVPGTFDPDTQLAYHFSDNPGQPTSDLTANHNSAQNGPPGIDESGIIGRAAKFPGQGTITIPASPSLAIPAGGKFTMTAWVRPEQLAGEQVILARDSMAIGIANGTPFLAIGPARVQATAAVKQGDWTHIGVVADGATIKLYVNGVEAGAASAPLPALAGPITLGAAADGRPFVGELDEVRLARVDRPAAMMQAFANGEGPQGKLVAVADTAEKQTGGTGVFGFVISKLEPLDQVVVGLCLLLLAGAVAVMIMKNSYLNAAKRGNAVFMKRFHQMHEDLVPLDRIKDISPQEIAYIGKSPLGRLYNVGIDELELRLAADRTRVLPAQSIAALRAAVDAQQVAENQKFDQAMVLLTIAISGGPFIGLLGTVIGVMSTFGGVALAGDVNVNAIAPGIAAALLATIAGLSAAIPSLFGYNYLNSRITAMANEMHVFADRLVTRLAEIQANSVMRRAAE